MLAPFSCNVSNNGSINPACDEPAANRQKTLVPLLFCQIQLEGNCQDGSGVEDISLLEMPDLSLCAKNGSLMEGKTNR
jgi:hypothetical protein